ncbi:MAG: aromatic ring-hydroxylating dioxygenase subunit alpha [Planctomycetes bacterium]|nr:aromatic ring-hydroxylating dioxygenase subunit alpha [Planctomycetota bacterium]
MDNDGDPEARPFQVLRSTWQPVALSRDLKAGGIISYRLLDEDIVVARMPSGLAAYKDGCPHRGARFGLGKVVGDHLQCPYHGWRFDRGGQCRLIPSLGEGSAVARSAKVASYAVAERYGFVWVRLEDREACPIPAIPEFEDPAWTYVVAEPTPFGAGFRREIENYLDMSHFAFAHADTLGKAAIALIDKYQVTEYPDGFQMDAAFPALSTEGAAISKLQQAHDRVQRCHMPNVTTIRQRFHDGQERVLVHVPSPNTRTSCTVFWSIAISPGFQGPAPDQQMAFAVRVLDEDRVMCENQRPLEVPMRSEACRYVPADRLALTYRKMFAGFCAAAPAIPADSAPAAGCAHPSGAGAAISG